MYCILGSKAAPICKKLTISLKSWLCCLVTNAVLTLILNPKPLNLVSSKSGSIYPKFCNTSTILRINGYRNSLTSRPKELFSCSANSPALRLISVAVIFDGSFGIVVSNIAFLMSISSSCALYCCKSGCWLTANCWIVGLFDILLGTGLIAPGANTKLSTLYPPSVDAVNTGIVKPNALNEYSLILLSVLISDRAFNPGPRP